MPLVRTRDVVNDETEKTSFDDLGAPPKILKAFAEMGFSRPSPVQIAAVPVGLRGVDMVVQAKSGTGKTAAFGAKE